MRVHGVIWLAWTCIAMAFEEEFATLVAKATNQSLLWGTYRPNLFFGTRPRLPESLMTGLAWFPGDQVYGMQHWRHDCRGEGTSRLGYQKHDGRHYGAQSIHDDMARMEISTEFVKVSSPDSHWGVRIRGRPLDPQESPVTHLVFYFTIAGEGSIDLVSPLSASGLSSPVQLEGDTPDLGDFAIDVIDDPGNQSPLSESDRDLSRAQWWGTALPVKELWKAADYIKNALYTRARQATTTVNSADLIRAPYQFLLLPNQLDEQEGAANMYAIQRVYKGSFEFDVIFRPLESDELKDKETLKSRLSERESDFDARFEKTFGLADKGFSEAHIGFAKYMLSNLLGGIGYFYGSSLVNMAPNKRDQEEDGPSMDKATSSLPSSLFTATPSRTFFPRGFYWDEGFHQLVIGMWDTDLSLDMIRSWIGHFDENGWVPRELILGDEARNRVPSEFQVQSPMHANPPTLLLAIKQFLDRVRTHAPYEATEQAVFTLLGESDTLLHIHRDHPAMAHRWMKQVYPTLKRHWSWWRKTQKADLGFFDRGLLSDEAYQWQGRTPNHTFASGLDDYPRAEPPHPNELHSDLLAWMAFQTRLLRDMAEYLDHAEDALKYSQALGNMMTNLDALHWNSTEGGYCDQTIVDDEPVHVCRLGYITILPLALELLPHDAPQVGALLDLMADDTKLWSSHGLRSLSKSDPAFGTDENYWRGPVWININYLVLQSLHKYYARLPGPYQAQAQALYTRLRDAIINTTFNSYQTSGTMWEQYDEATGKGKGSYPFAGWTSLVLLIMAEQYA